MAIISYSNGFIFIKNLKTAGTSVEVHLSQYCSDTDIVTRIEPPNPLHTPRNFAGAAGEPVFYNHMPAVHIRALLPDHFPAFYKFCFERHPVDKCLSHCAMLINSPKQRAAKGIESWEQYVEEAQFPTDFDRYTDAAGALLVDKIYKYEALADAVSAISRKLGLPDRPLLVREKAGFRYGVPTVAEVMARPAERRLIFEAFAPTLRFVDYS